MTLEEFKLDLEARLAAMSDEEIRAAFAGWEYWLDAVPEEQDTITTLASRAPVTMALDSGRLALAA